MATLLQIYNIALRNIGARPLESVTDEQESRRYLDASIGLARDMCLRSGFWNFAMRVTKRDPDLTEPSFYYSFAYTKPADWVATRDIAATEILRPALMDFQDQSGFWLTNVSPLYVRYVSNDPAFGGNLSMFPSDYSEYLGAYLGGLVFMQTTGHDVTALAVYKKTVVSPAMKMAMASDATDGPAEQRPYGSWVSARRGADRVTSTRSGFLRLGG